MIERGRESGNSLIPTIDERPNPDRFDAMDSLAPMAAFYERVCWDTMGSGTPVEGWSIPSQPRFVAQPLAPVPRSPRRPFWVPARIWHWLRTWNDPFFLTPEEQQQEKATELSRVGGAVWGVRVAVARSARPQEWEHIASILEYLLGDRIDVPVVARLLRGDIPNACAGPIAGTTDAMIAACLPGRINGVTMVPLALAGWRYLKHHLLQSMRAVSMRADDEVPDEALWDESARSLPSIDDLLTMYMYCWWIQKIIRNAGALSIDRLWVKAWLECKYDLILPGVRNDMARRLATRFTSHTVNRAPPLRSPETCRDVLHVAFWANLGAASYAQVIEAAQSLGGDTVSCAAAAGAVAGAVFGKAGIEADGRMEVDDADRVARIVDAASRRLVSPLEAA